MKRVRLYSKIQGYLQHVNQFSLNAKLYLVSSALRGFGVGIWGIIFYLYLNLNEIGFDLDFIGYVFSVRAIAAGLIALPIGLVYERIGGKKALLIGFCLSTLISLPQIFTLQPLLLLFTNVAVGLAATLGRVASAPFMAENSRRKERTYLFSINWATMIIVGVLGLYIGGLLPDMFNGLINLPTGINGSAVGYRVSLIISTILSFSALIPLLLIRENRLKQRPSFSDLLSLKNIQSRSIIVKFMVPTALIGFGAGFIVPLFSLFLKQKFFATTVQIGVISAMSRVTVGFGTLIAPLISSKLGKVRSIVTCQFLSTPFIMLITLSPNLSSASVAQVLRTVLMNMAAPVNSTLQMEMVTENERGTANGLMIMADSLPRAATASLSGELMAEGDFFSPFLYTSIFYLLASSTYYLFFRKAEHTKKADKI